jgi:hypothetical protein
MTKTLKPAAAEDRAPQPSGIAGDPRRILSWKERNPLPLHLRRAAEEIDADIKAARDAAD